MSSFFSLRAFWCSSTVFFKAASMMISSKVWAFFGIFFVLWGNYLVIEMEGMFRWLLPRERWISVVDNEEFSPGHTGLPCNTSLYGIYQSWSAWAVRPHHLGPLSDWVDRGRSWGRGDSQHLHSAGQERLVSEGWLDYGLTSVLHSSVSVHSSPSLRAVIFRTRRIIREIRNLMLLSEGPVY